MYPLECQDVSASYGTQLALDRVSFRLEPGRVLGVLGPNGSGKTTLFRVFLGFKRLSAGTLRVLGGNPGDPSILGRLGATLESPSYYPHLSGLDNLRATAWLKGMSTEGLAAILEEVGLLEAGSKPCSLYSFGMRQRLALAQSILGNPELLILDEPTNGLDPEGVHWIREWIRHRATVHGQTVVLASHMLAEVAQIADDVLVLREGVPRFHGTLQALHDQGSSEIRVRVNDAGAGTAALRRQGFGVQAKGREDLRVEAPASTCPEVARVLLAEGLELFELGSLQGSLEARYLDLMEVQ